MRRIRWLVPVLLFAAARLSPAAEVLSARMRTEPATPYVGEDFKFVLEVTATPGGEIGIDGVVGLPASLLTETSFTADGVREGTADTGGTVHVHAFSIAARSASPLFADLRIAASVRTTERTSMGFFTGTSSRVRTVAVSTRPLEIRALPPDGRPDDFSGAVGRFRMRLEAEPAEVMPQDIVELRLTLSGTGFLGDAVPAMPVLDPALFKTYPATVRRDEGGARLVISQSVIPLSTNAVEIGVARLAFFDASSGVYTNACTEPVRLVFRERERKDAPAVREVRVDAPSHAPAGKDGLDVSRYLTRPRGATSLSVTRETLLRVAPGPQAKAILPVPAGSKAVGLESGRGWIRVKVQGRTGWLAAGDVE